MLRMGHQKMLFFNKYILYRSRKENHQLKEDYQSLQESYKELEALKEKLEGNEMMWQINLTDAQKDSNATKQQVSSHIDTHL